MPKSEISDKIIKISNLNATKSNIFRWRSDASNNSKIAEKLSLISIEKIDFNGKIIAQGKNKWLLSGNLGATAMKECVVTLQAVKCRVDEKIKRIYVPLEEIPSIEKDDGRDVNLELDENLEPLTGSLDLSSIVQETLALSLPDYPRSNNADYVSISLGDDEQTTQQDNKQNPFAILRTLKKN
tara:strand:- start:169 stop:717 length:549 start_codon:yes stop_codon:yes gene_type:complete